MKVQRGDQMLVVGSGLLSTLIKLRTGSQFTHGLIICDKYGKTFEALKTIRHGHLGKYIGKRVVIARPEVDEAVMDEAIKEAENKWDGHVYPFWRLIFHLMGVARFSLLDIPVCSELNAWVSRRSGIPGKPWAKTHWGVNPDDISEEWMLNPRFKFIWRGKLTADAWVEKYPFDPEGATT
jgi:hypothetical protein